MIQTTMYSKNPTKLQEEQVKWSGHTVIQNLKLGCDIGGS